MAATLQSILSKAKMATGNANLQWSFLDTCIIDDLVAIVERESDSKNPMTYSIGDHLSMMGILEKHFDSLHPIHIRLAKMASLKPATNQTPADFYAEFIKVLNKANAKQPPSEQLAVALMPRREPQNGASQ